jgi:hypothetical protein
MILALTIVFAPLALAAPGTDYYMATDGNYAPDGSTATDPWITFQYSISRFKAGDSLIIREGVYNMMGVYIGVPDEANKQASYLTRQISGLSVKHGPSEDAATGSVTVNFPGVNDVIVQYCSGEVWATVEGTFADTTGMITLPADTTSVRAVKGGMGYQFDDISFDDEPLVLDAPVKTITVLGIFTTCELSLMQQGELAYPPEPAVVHEQTVYNVFDNDKPYEVSLTKAGFFPIERQHISAGQTINFGSPYFYQIVVPAGITQVRIKSNGPVVEDANAGQIINLLSDFLGTIQTAQLSFVYGGIKHDVEFLLDCTDPFDFYNDGMFSIATAKVRHLIGNINELIINVTEIHLDGTKAEYTATVSINNNAVGIYIVGPYSVYVDSKGNTQIRAYYIIK